MEDQRDPKHPRDNKIFTTVAVGVEGNVIPPMQPIGIGKRPRESSKAINKVGELAKHVVRVKWMVLHLTFLLELSYNSVKA